MRLTQKKRKLLGRSGSVDGPVGGTLGMAMRKALRIAHQLPPRKPKW